ncbi:class C sortase [Ruminococcaceae bacterium OttesenSCG-928-A16]|nr:class C sortase [Ruminococcaceae bacterium OttesenSCG-928-A16]
MALYKKKQKNQKPKQQQQPVKQSKKTSVPLLIVLFFIGLAVLLYPAVSNWLSTRRSVAQINVYEQDISALSKDFIDGEWEKAVDYNNSLKGDPVKDPFIPGSGKALPQNYLNVLNVSGIMCTIEIPSINVNLPIYHGVSDEVLQKGVGHMEGTALPIGGKGTHSILTGHTGLPTAHLFTDLIDLVEGDKFYIHVLGRELVYQVDQIKVILPDDISDLDAYGDEDYVTLITCTPYGVNSHRLLVRGHRVYQISKSITLQANLSIQFTIVLVLAVLGILLILLVFIWRWYQWHKQKYPQKHKKRPKNKRK